MLIDLAAVEAQHDRNCDCKRWNGGRYLESCLHYSAAILATTQPVPEPVCDGLCIYASEVLPGAVGVAYPHPSCPLHSPDETVCGCGYPDVCLSPTHGQISMVEALAMRHRQAGNR